MRAGLVKVYSIDLDPPPTEVGECRMLLNAAEVERARQFEHPVERNQWIVSRGMLRRALAIECECDPAEIQFTTEANQKTRLADVMQRNNIHYSLARSGDLALIAITSVAPVGIDIERVVKLNKFDQITASISSEIELFELRSLPEKDKIISFYTQWTQKEAIIKTGLDAVQGKFYDMHMRANPHLPPKFKSIAGQENSPMHWRIENLNQFTGFCAAVALQSNHPISVEVLDRIEPYALVG